MTGDDYVSGDDTVQLERVMDIVARHLEGLGRWLTPGSRACQNTATWGMAESWMRQAETLMRDGA